MGSIGSTGRLGAFQNDVFASGLDLGRCEIHRDMGVFKAASNATILQGQMVSLNSDGELVLADAGDVFGVAKWNKATLGKSVNVDEVATVVAGGVTNLARGNVSNVRVNTAVNGGGTLVSAAGDYTLSVANGTLTWEASPAEVTNGQTVYVTYTFDLTASDYQFQGLNFFNQLDDVTVAESRLTVIQGPALIFTTQYDTSEVFAVNAPVYCGGDTAGEEGLFTTTSTNSELVGHVVQPPRADDPYLGIAFLADRPA